MRISDWSSDVCSSDLGTQAGAAGDPARGVHGDLFDRRVDHRRIGVGQERAGTRTALARPPPGRRRRDRKSVVWGTSVSVRVELGGGRSIKKNKKRSSLSKVSSKIRISKI